MFLHNVAALAIGGVFVASAVADFQSEYPYDLDHQNQLPLVFSKHLEPVAFADGVEVENHPPPHKASDKTIYQLLQGNPHFTKLAKLVNISEEVVSLLNDTSAAITFFAVPDEALTRPNRTHGPPHRHHGPPGPPGKGPKGPGKEPDHPGPPHRLPDYPPWKKPEFPGGKIPEFPGGKKPNFPGKPETKTISDDHLDFDTFSTASESYEQYGLAELLIEVEDLELAFDAPNQEERKKFLVKILKAILSYHILPTDLTVSVLSHNTTHATNLTLLDGSLGGEPLRIRTQATLLPPSLKVNLFSKVIKADIKAINGIVHVVNHPLFPPPSVFQETFIVPFIFSYATTALQRVGLTDELDLHFVHGEDGAKGSLEGSKAVTFFAPTNGAFKALPKKLQFFLFSPFGQRALKKLLQYHIVPGYVLHSDWAYNASSSDSLVFAAPHPGELPLEYEQPDDEPQVYGCADDETSLHEDWPLREFRDPLEDTEGSEYHTTYNYDDHVFVSEEGGFDWEPTKMPEHQDSYDFYHGEAMSTLEDTVYSSLQEIDDHDDHSIDQLLPRLDRAQPHHGKPSRKPRGGCHPLPPLRRRGGSCQAPAPPPHGFCGGHPFGGPHFGGPPRHFPREGRPGHGPGPICDLFEGHPPVHHGPPHHLPHHPPHFRPHPGCKAPPFGDHSSSGHPRPFSHTRQSACGGMRQPVHFPSGKSCAPPASQRGHPHRPPYQPLHPHHPHFNVTPVNLVNITLPTLLANHSLHVDIAKLKVTLPGPHKPEIYINKFRVNHQPLALADLVARNGAIHVIRKVLNPHAHHPPPHKGHEEKQDGYEVENQTDEWEDWEEWLPAWAAQD